MNRHRSDTAGVTKHGTVPPRAEIHAWVLTQSKWLACRQSVS